MASLSQLNTSLNSWLVKESNTITDKLFEGSKEKTRVDTGYAQSRWQVTKRIYKPGETAEIINDADYIGWLNFGTAYTEGDHMVERTIQEVKKDYE